MHASSKDGYILYLSEYFERYFYLSGYLGGFERGFFERGHKVHQAKQERPSENFFYIYGFTDDVDDWAGLQAAGGGVVDFEFSAFTDIDHVASGNGLDGGHVCGQISRSVREWRVNDCDAWIGCGVVDGEAGLSGRNGAGARSDTQLAIAAQGDPVMDGVRDGNSSDHGRYGGGIQ